MAGEILFFLVLLFCIGASAHEWHRLGSRKYAEAH
jgi:hypothetical protein